MTTQPEQPALHSRRGLAFRCAALSAVALATGALAAPLAFSLRGWIGVWAECVAGTACFLGALAALALAEVLHGPRLALHGLLFGMAARMIVPLAVVLPLHFRGGALADAGLAYYLLVFYPVCLAADTLLCLPGGASNPTTLKGS